ncbi:MAG: hypothetical protein RIB45_13125 [Marivibrio sp.]|uniref:hypothetical protein n=1 Tax=Marivibrio sp. TaxID=2039719 RepID=UPI0032F075F4
MLRRLTLALAFSLIAAPAVAGGAAVSGVEIEKTGERTYRVTATVRHDDEGWEHYSNAFTVETIDGEVLGVRTLHHPHVDEQPFTRSLDGVEIPPDVNTVTVRARDSVHGFDGRGMTVIVPD